jgi:hypothetical protein
MRIVKLGSYEEIKGIAILDANGAPRAIRWNAPLLG